MYELVSVGCSVSVNVGCIVSVLVALSDALIVGEAEVDTDMLTVADGEIVAETLTDCDNENDSVSVGWIDSVALPDNVSVALEDSDVEALALMLLVAVSDMLAVGDSLNVYDHV